MSLYKITEFGSAWGPILSLQKNEVWRLGVAAQSHSPSAWVTNLAGPPGLRGWRGCGISGLRRGQSPATRGWKPGTLRCPSPSASQAGEETVQGRDLLPATRRPPGGRRLPGEGRGPPRAPRGSTASGLAGELAGPALGTRGGTKRPGRGSFEPPEEVDLGRGPGRDGEGGSAPASEGEAGGGERGARGGRRPSRPPAGSARAGGGGSRMGGPGPLGCDPADPPLGAPPPQPGARAGGV